MTDSRQTNKRITAGNSTYPKVAVQWLNQALCFYQSFCLVDSEVLRNRHLRVAANRYAINLESMESQQIPPKSPAIHNPTSLY